MELFEDQLEGALVLHVIRRRAAIGGRLGSFLTSLPGAPFP